MRTQAICLALAIVLLCPYASAQWVHTSLPDSLTVSCFAVRGTYVFAGIDEVFADTYIGRGVFLSTNNGTSWAAVNEGLPVRRGSPPGHYAYIKCFASSGQILFAGTTAGVFLSTNNGTSWTLAGTDDGVVDALAVSGTNLFAGVDGYGVFLSTDSGTTWTAVNNGLTDTSITSLAVSGTNLFAGTGWGGGVFLSTNDGTSWTAVNSGLPQNTVVRALAVSGTNLSAGTGDGFFLSTNNGTSWTAANTPFGGIFSMAPIGSNLFAGGDGGVFLSTDSGISWTAVNSGLPQCNSVHALAVSGTNLFAGRFDWCGLGGAGIWRRPLSEMITSVEPATSELPHEFQLQQNYPNPFNPGTTIKFELPKTSHVTLSVYDMLGRMVSVLVNERRNAGVHEVRFDGSNLASGVYFYRLQAGDVVRSKKFVLLK